MTNLGNMTKTTTAPLADRVYRDASKLTGKTEAELRTIALKTFAAMLLHAMDLDGRPVWTVCRMQGKHLDLEVNTRPRRPVKTTTNGHQ